ncbi:MAG: hypothetical protein IKM82_01450 [Oscillospiraceae bacterium]|nr:hypothetical protein [Oscillospiraceae bacterium]MBR7074888.1 hypothetical protein [Oscillospiraceae bacterium]
MMNLTRGEDFTLELFLDGDPDEYDWLEVNIVQDGERVFNRKKADAERSAGGQSAYFAFTGAETSRLRAGTPAFARARGAFPDGAVMQSAVEEICVLDAFGTGGEKPWS